MIGNRGKFLSLTMDASSNDRKRGQFLSLTMDASSDDRKRGNSYHRQFMQVAMIGKGEIPISW